MFQDAGIAEAFHPAARTEAEVDGALLALGLRRVVSLQLDGERELTVGAFLHWIESGEVS